VFEGEEFIQALEPAEAHEIALDPLADLSAPLGLERSMAQPHRAALTPPPDPSEAERYDAALFEQIAGEPGGIMAHAMAEGARRVPREPRVVMPLGLRVTTYLLLLVAALAPFVLPPLSDGWVQPRAATVALGEAVAALPADSRVLLVWDYDASYSGELDPLAGTLIGQVQVRGAQIDVVALTPASLVQARRVVNSALGASAGDVAFLGYIPAGEAGLRLLADGVPAGLLDTASARGQATPLGTYRLIVLLADNAAVVQGWVEQVGVYTGITPWALVSARSEPTLLPYVQSGQLQGVLGAAWAAAEYEVVSGVPGEAVRRATGQAGLAIVIILVGVAAMVCGPGRQANRGGHR